MPLEIKMWSTKSECSLHVRFLIGRKNVAFSGFLHVRSKNMVKKHNRNYKISTHGIELDKYDNTIRQEAQLSQRYRATFYVM